MKACFIETLDAIRPNIALTPESDAECLLLRLFLVHGHTHLALKGTTFANGSVISVLIGIASTPSDLHGAAPVPHDE